jgi:hypothetical protein
VCDDGDPVGFVLGRRSVKVRQLTYQRLKPAPTTALATAAAAAAAAHAAAQTAATDATDAAFLGGRNGGGGGGNEATKSAAAAAAAAAVATAATAEAEADAEMIDLLLGAETESDGEESDESGGGDESVAESRRAALEVSPSRMAPPLRVSLGL